MDSAERSAVDRTAKAIAEGGPFGHARDGVVFRNREGRLPRKRDGYYLEYTVATAGVAGRGGRRIVAGAGGELYYTADHYGSFVRITMEGNKDRMVAGFSEAMADAPRRPALAAAGADVVIDAAGVTDKAAFLALVARILDFPAYFGGNWDALEECLGEAPWPAGKRITVRNAGQLDQAVVAQFIAIVTQAGITAMPGDGDPAS